MKNNKDMSAIRHILLLLASVFILVSCRSNKDVVKYVETPVYIHDTTSVKITEYVNVFHSDTVYIHDSINTYIDENGVVHSDKSHSEYKSRNNDRNIERDSSQYKVKEVPVITKEKETEIQIQKVYVWKPFIIVLIVCVVGGFLVYLKKKKAWKFLIQRDK